MNAASGKVLQKVLTGFIITKPDMRWGRISRGRRRRCLEMKRVPGRSGLTFKCHRATNRKKEKEREKHAEKYQTQLISIRRKNIGTHA